jgi:hypothetical protein
MIDIIGKHFQPSIIYGSEAAWGWLRKLKNGAFIPQFVGMCDLIYK